MHRGEQVPPGYYDVMQLLFISDLHLDLCRPRAIARFHAFLDTETRAADAVYILGDLFEAWIGDDETSALSLQVSAALSAVRDRGSALHLMHGNRDFLLGEDFAAAAGCELLQEPCLLRLGEVPTLLLHGDSLCTGDAQYQALRQELRDPAWQQDFLARPLAERRRMANELRALSAAANRMKPEDITDADPAAVIDVMERYRAQVLVHGHTHRPAVHQLQAGGAAARRFVLGAWEENAPSRCLRWQDGDWSLFSYPQA